MCMIVGEFAGKCLKNPALLYKKPDLRVSANHILEPRYRGRYWPSWRLGMARKNHRTGWYAQDKKGLPKAVKLAAIKKQTGGDE